MSQRDLNHVMLIGNLGDEPKLTTTSKGAAVCTFRLATNRSWLAKGEEERREETEWHGIVAFGGLAEICPQLLAKGTKVFIGGRIQNRELTNDQGEAFKLTEIVAEDLIILDKQKSNGEVRHD